MSSETATETKYCNNCKKDIAAANFTMHEMHCRRHLVLCEHCEEPVPRTELEEHFNEVHAKVACTQCAKELEKDQLDDHLKDDCPKRDVACEFCELEMPNCDLAAHVEFCGTRTEACPRCGNFVMHKDLPRHNESNCTFPEVKPPSNQSNGLRHGGGGDDHMFIPNLANFGGFRDLGRLDDSFDPFEFEEIRRALEGDMEGRGMPSLVTDSDATTTTEERGRRRRGGGAERTIPVIPARQRNDTRGGGRKVATNRRSEVNRQRERASSPTIPPDVDYDTMLAMQLAAEDDDDVNIRGPVPSGPDPDFEIDPDADLNRLLNDYENRSRSHVNRHVPMEQDDPSVPSGPPPAYDEFAAADEDMIPCEFCGENFPAFALVHHQSVCDPLASGLWGQEVRPAAGRNNEMTYDNEWTPAVARPPAIPVINNLGSASPAVEQEEELPYHLTDNGDHMLNSLENIMLPCEFCNELLPADALVQHQAMCESNPQATPRVMTPAAAQPSSGGSPTARNQFFPTSNTNTRHRQPDPTEALLAALAGDQENEGGNIRPKKRPNAPRPTNQRGTTFTSSRTGASGVLQARGGSSRAAEEEQDFSLHNQRGSRPGGRRDSATRTRHTLDALLSDEGTDTQGSQGSRRKPNNRAGPATNTGVSARTVMRSMQPRTQQRDQASDTGGPRNRNGERQRGDHLFNNLGNARNPASQNRPGRSSNRQTPEWN